jgi:hypothetical protein
MTEDKEELTAKSRERSPEEDRFYVAYAKHGLFQAFGIDEESPIESLAETFVLASAVGWAHKARVPLGKRQHVGFLRSIDAKAGLPLLQAIAIAETGDPSVVADQGAMLTIAEEYANGGIDLLASLDRGNRDRTVIAIAGMLLGDVPMQIEDPTGALSGLDVDLSDL